LKSYSNKPIKMGRTLCSLLIFIFSDISLYSQFLGGGSGTETDPYKIYTKKHLQELADSVNADYVDVSNWPYRDNWSKDKYFMLMNDIPDSVNMCIGNNRTAKMVSRFQGVFDGNNKAINLAIEANTRNGLFVLGNSAVIKNLITTGYIHYDGITASALGIAYYMNVNDTIIINNIINITNITSNRQAAGIIIAQMYNSIIGNCIVENCINYGYIKGTRNVSGIALANGLTIINCLNFGVLSDADFTGCIISSPGIGTTVINCHYDKQMCGGDD